METKDYMFEFIIKHQKNYVPTLYIEEIVNIETKDCDDEHGGMGEHYVVTLKQRIVESSLTSGYQTKLVESNCLVNIKQFNDFVEKHKAVIWL
jgi:hypothetical protein